MLSFSDRGLGESWDRGNEGTCRVTDWNNSCLLLICVPNVGNYEHCVWEMCVMANMNISNLEIDTNY